MRRVVVTGLGVVAPNGLGREEFWSACVNGRSGVGPIRSFDASSHPVRIAAEVPDFDMTPSVPPAHRKNLKILGRAARFGVAARTPSRPHPSRWERPAGQPVPRSAPGYRPAGAAWIWARRAAWTLSQALGVASLPATARIWARRAAWTLSQVPLSCQV
jgi:hypothetical protein